MNTIKETTLTYVISETERGGITEENLAERIIAWHSWKWRNLDGSDNFKREDIAQAVEELISENKIERAFKQLAWRTEPKEILRERV